LKVAVAGEGVLETGSREIFMELKTPVGEEIGQLVRVGSGARV
jgi:hypothetical protein